MKGYLKHLKENWLYLLSLVAILSLGYFYWQLYGGQKLSSLFQNQPDISETNDTLEQTGYNIGYKVGSSLGFLYALRYGFLGLLSLSILIAEFNYKSIFKELFVSNGGTGKFLYVLVSLFLAFFLFFAFKLSLPKSGVEFGLHMFAAIFITAFSLIYAVIKYTNESFKSLKELTYAKTKAELNALKAQINPHFLFNVLNNLYGQAIVEGSPKTAEGIQNLSRIMRHVVEETKTQRSSIEKEILFLEDYLKLQKMRLPERPNIDIKIDIEWDKKEEVIAPLLLIPFIENAFKYGISMNEPCFIYMNLVIREHILDFSIKNSIIKKEDILELSTNTGLANTRKRLQLHYPESHELKIEKDQSEFSVKLTIHL